MTHTHTPGPWHIGKRAADVAIYGPKGQEVAKILGFFNDDEENKANARLISAAPELLEALEGLLHGSRKVTSQEDWNAEREEASATARAAIAKATGKGDA